MQKLLIPTDFDLRTLKYVPGIAEHFAPQKTTIVLVHMMKITDNVSELKMLAKRSAERKFVPPEFYDACKLLVKDIPGLASIKIEFFYGSTLASFKASITENKISAAVLLSGYNYKLLFKHSIEPTLLINRSGINVINAHYKTKLNLPVTALNNSEQQLYLK
ncbi:hypothetical protein [Mucilaginibacter aquatilis]|uniref:Universal stress protein n=1 Tax=Mucilaginibacter aquatilis TaxID=1517760 RepID=A0A6I4I6T6_9SPHI|nr:hypothetical protein [Mucilaginibacter aquatilis]MVN90792.1 hypothetical protein [Mucilaginibacter aquatilis]